MLTMVPQFPGLWKLSPKCLLDVHVRESFVVLDRKGVKVWLLVVETHGREHGAGLLIILSEF